MVAQTSFTTSVDPASWVVCDSCRVMLYRKRLTRNLEVCPECNHHHRLSAPGRLTLLLDPGSIEPLDVSAVTADPLGFVDSKPYPRRLAEARARTGLEEAVVCARGTVDGKPLVAAVMDFRFMGGSLGSAVGELITQAAEEALRTRTPLLIVSASGGARMQEGVFSLMQMAKTSQALRMLDDAGVLTISLISDPTFGGVAASFATLCDVIIAEPRARLGFAGSRVIEQTIRQQLPPGFQTAEFLLEHGMVDLIRARPGLRQTLGRLLRAGSAPVTGRGIRAARAVGGPRGGEGGGEGGAGLPEPLVTVADDLPERPAWEVVRRARHLGRPTTLDYVHRVLDEFEELHGDRLGSDCTALVGGLGLLDGIPVVLLGHQKGHDVAELTARNFGMPRPAGYRKAARLMRLAAKLGIPVVTLVDTPGAYPGIDAEEQGQAVAIAENLRLMSGLPVPVVAVVTGEGGSGGALALAVADRVLMCSNAVYSVISPEGCAAILWKDPAAAPAAAAALRVDARELLRLGVVDGVVREPSGGTESNHHLAAARLRAALLAELDPLLRRNAAALVERRHARFRRFGNGPAAGAEPREPALLTEAGR